ncbi:MAG: CHASE2 domain-containing protein [Deinococcus sp.]|nr:CHASE2 domain-containing protein [Deinococcus sp.]
MTRPPSSQGRWWSAPGRHASWPYLLLVSLLLGGVLGLIWPYNSAAWNLAAQVFPRPNPQAMLVDIDPASLADYGPLHTWTPELYRSAVEQLQQAGAKSVGLDVLLDPARPGAAELNRFFSQAGVVLAVSPQDLPAPLQPTSPQKNPSRSVSSQGGPAQQVLARAPASDGQQPLTGISVLDRDVLGLTYAFQAGYRTADGQVLPTLAWQLAHAAGSQVPLDTRLRFLHRFDPPVLDTRLSFRDVAAGRFRYADVQGKAVVIGQASQNPAQQAGSDLQARAVASLMMPAYLSFPAWAAALLGALVTGLSFSQGRFLGLLIALLSPLLLLLLWRAGVAFPGLTLCSAALIGLLLAGIEYLLAQRGARLHSTFSEQVLGTRAALSRAVEALLTNSSSGRPGQAYLFLIRLGGYRPLAEHFGREWAEEGLDQGLRRLRDLGPQFLSLEGFGFRWACDELVFIVDPVESEAAAQYTAGHFAQSLAEVSLRGHSLDPSVGYTAVQLPPDTPLDAVSAQSLLDMARPTLRPASPSQP